MMLQRRLARIKRAIERLRVLDNRYSWGRLSLFFAGSVLTLVSFALQPLAGWAVLLIALVVFSLVVYRHQKIRRTLAQLKMWYAIQSEHIARLKLDWAHLPAALPSSAESDHPFEPDLDLTGERSLHRLLDTAVSWEGGLRLRDRLLTPPPNLKTVMNRQSLVSELIPLRHFRDRLTLGARMMLGHSRRRWETGELSKWFDQPPPSGRLGLALLAAILLAVVNLILFLLDAANVLPALWQVTFLVYMGVYLTQARQVMGLFEQGLAMRDALAPLGEVARNLETRSYAGKRHLQRVCAPFSGDKRPSVQLGRLMWVISAASLRYNPFVWGALNVLIPWDLFVAYRLNHYRTDLAVHVPEWLDAWFEIETACSLATFGDLNASYIFPQISSDATFQAQGLGHPLIPAERRVCNDFSLDKLGEVALITGSNMSGKSSFLRTLGINLCLTYAGAPVNADSLEVGLFRVYTSIRLNDSLADGFSGFYAEVRRLKALLTALEAEDQQPLFFLIDEIFRATNNRERLIGSQSYIQALIGKHGMGVVSTHDLELTSLPGPINYHFEDQVVDGQMTFDYRIRSGPSPTTNALKIMRLAGLPVQD
ncbi:MAG: hypothetical protein K8L97_27950 [Anaerolineae bacterium]|nr:hypothetical protein [Anaerolineae bacterium]